MLDGHGHVPPAPDAYFECDFGVYGPMARGSDDLKLLWSVLRGTPEQSRRGVEGARVAVWDAEPAWPLAREVRDGVARAADALAEAGADVEPAKPDIDGEEMMDFYNTLLTPIIALGMPEEMMAAFEAMRGADKQLAASGGEGAGVARFRLRATAPFREMAAAMARRQAAKDRLAAFFRDYDAILMPIDMTLPFAHLQEGTFADRVLTVDGVAVPYSGLLNWISLATALHAPALAVQAGRTAQGLPVGVQLVGPWHGEDRLFDFATAIEEQLGGFTPPPL